MTKSKRQLRADAVERLRKLNCMDVDCYQLLEAVVDDAGEKVGYRVEISKLIDLLTDDAHESRGSYEERLHDVPVSDCPYCGCKRVVIHDFSDIYEKPHSYRVEHVDEKEAFEAGCFETYYSFDSVEKAVEHANMRDTLTDEPTNGIEGETNGIADGSPLDAQSRAEIEDMERSRAVSGDSGQDADVDSTEDAKAAQDTREKLEADVRIRFGDGLVRNIVMRLLDRQASITERHWMEICGANANANVELNRQNDELRLKVRRQGKQLAELQDAIHKRNEGVLKDSWKKQLAELEAERDMYRDKLGRAIDAAHEIARMVDE